MMVGGSGKKIRVLFLVPSLRRAGAETQLIDLANALDSASFKKTLCAFESNLDQLDRVNHAEIEFHHCLRTHKYNFSMVKQIARLIDQQHIDVIHCTIQIALLVGWLAVKLAIRKPKLIVAIHTTVNVTRKFELFDQLLYRWLLGACDRIVFVCRAQAEYWGTKYPSSRARSVVIYNGVDIDRYRRTSFERAGDELRRTLAIPQNAHVLTCIAGFRPEKGHRYLIEAFTTLQGEPYLMLAGDGPLRTEMEALAAERRIGDRMRFLGEVGDVRPVLAATDLSVLTSTAVETFSIAMLESMAMEVPVVATDVGGLAEAIVPGKSGALVEPADAGGLAKVLSDLLEDRVRLKNMGKCARRRVHEDFSTEVMTHATGRMLTDVVAAPAS